MNDKIISTLEGAAKELAAGKPTHDRAKAANVIGAAIEILKGDDGLTSGERAEGPKLTATEGGAPSKKP